MTGPDFRSIRERLGWTQQGLAERLGVTVRAVRYYEAGSRKVPGPVARLLAVWEAEHVTSEA